MRIPLAAILRGSSPSRLRNPLRPTRPRPPRSRAVSGRGPRAQAARVVTGRNVARSAPPRRRLPAVRSASLFIVATGAVCAALGLVALRMDSVRLRYALADAVRAEQDLLDEQRSLTVEMRQLRDPRRLERLGSELGLGPAGCLIDLDHPRPCPSDVRAGWEWMP